MDNENQGIPLGHTPLNEDRWCDIVQDILQGNAILVLGPGATVNYDMPELQSSFLRKLAETDPLRVADFHAQDGLLVFRPRGRDRLSARISDFYREVQPNPSLDLLAELPFHYYVSLTPDLALQKSFERKGFEFEFGYNNRAPAREFEWPSAKRPLLYSLLGSAEEGKESSLVVSHGDLFELIESVHLRDSIPESLLAAFSVKPDRSKTIIFLGLEYERWYYHFLLHLFKIGNNLSPVAAASDLPAGFHLAIYESYFKVTFVQERLLDFVIELHKRFPTARTRSYETRCCRRLHSIMLECLGDEELTRLCEEDFAAVSYEFTAGQTKSQRVRLLVEMAHRTGECMKLTELVSKINPMCCRFLETNGQ